MAFARKSYEKIHEAPRAFDAGLSVGRPAPIVAADGAAGLLAPITYVEQTITHTDLDAAATTQAIAVAGFPANAAPLFAEIKRNAVFAGGSASAVAITVGDAGAANELLTTTSVFTGQTLNTWVQTTGAALNGKFQREAAYAPLVTFTATDDDVDNLTTGSVTVRIYYVLLPA